MLQLPAFWLFLTIASALEINWSFQGNRRLQSSQLKKWRRMAALSGYTKKTHFCQRWHTRCAFQSMNYFSPSFKDLGACGERVLFAAILLCHHVNSTMARWRYICSTYFFRYIFFCHPAPKLETVAKWKPPSFSLPLLLFRITPEFLDQNNFE